MLLQAAVSAYLGKQNSTIGGPVTSTVTEGTKGLKLDKRRACAMFLLIAVNHRLQIFLYLKHFLKVLSDALIATALPGTAPVNPICLHIVLVSVVPS